MWLFSIFSIFTKLSQLFQLTLTSCLSKRERNIFHIMKQMNDKCVDSNNQQRRKIYSKIFFHQSFFHIQMWERENFIRNFFFHKVFFVFFPSQVFARKKKTLQAPNDETSESDDDAVLSAFIQQKSKLFYHIFWFWLRT